MALRTPVLAIVGRPNVGKSTLFNRILGQRKAVVEDIPGVTRDRNYALVDRGFDFPFYLIDTGGFEETPEDELGVSTVLQTKLAIEEADLVIGVFDGNLGLQVGDRDIVNLLRASKKVVAYVVNKCDGIEMQDKILDFYALGVGDLVGLSALHGANVRSTVERLLRLLPEYERLKQSHISKKQNEEQRLAELRQEIVDDDAESDFLDDMPERRAVYDIDIDLENLDNLDAEKEEEEDTWEPMPVYSPEEGTIEDYLRAYRLQGKTRKEFFSDISEIEDEQDVVEEVEELEEEEVLPEIDCIKVAIIGRPNVGKSTLLNTITGETRSITSDVAGTTRDVVDVTITRNGQKFIILDTAGLRKKARVGQTVERYSVIRALRALEDADVAVVVIDGTTGVTEQDAKIVGLVHELGKGLVIAINKWDLVEKDHRTVNEYTKDVRNALKFAPYCEIIFISAASGRRCPKVIEVVRDTAMQRLRRVPTGKLNRLLRDSIRRKTLPVYRGRPVKLYYTSQVDVAPPRFALFFNYPRQLHFSYLRYLKNQIRDEFGFTGSDIKLHPKKR